MAPKSLELDIDQSFVTYQHIPRSLPKTDNLPQQHSLYAIKFGIPEKYISLHVSERERSLNLLREINSYYDELVRIYTQYPEFAINIYFSPRRFKCLKEYLLFLEEQLLTIRKYRINCKQRRLLVEIKV